MRLYGKIIHERQLVQAHEPYSNCVCICTLCITRYLMLNFEYLHMCNNYNKNNMKKMADIGENKILISQVGVVYF